MMGARIGIWEHFRKLAAFRGRENRASFWPYAALVLGILMVAQAVMVVPWIERSIRVAREQSSKHTEGLNVIVEANGYSIDVDGFVSPTLKSDSSEMLSRDFITISLVLTIGLAILLYAAAVVRRLHDCGKSGAWGLMPLPFLLYLAMQVPRMFGQRAPGEQPDTALVISLLIANLLYLVALAALVALLAGKGESGANRYDRPT
jgi:uncharacterized membrane protein YhaH (DUF805 family)